MELSGGGAGGGGGLLNDFPLKVMCFCLVLTSLKDMLKSSDLTFNP